MDCPKCKQATLLDDQLPQGVAVKRCKECHGTWLASSDYEYWQQKIPPKAATPELLRQKLSQAFDPTQNDIKAGLCPQCNRYLSRAKVKYQIPFFVERCQECEGFWLDSGEWNVLNELGLSSSIEQFFERQWQMKMREQEYQANERHTLIEKLGSELAQKIFNMAEELKDHPNGDYALAFLMRKVMNSMEVQDFRSPNPDIEQNC